MLVSACVDIKMINELFVRVIDEVGSDQAHLLGLVKFENEWARVWNLDSRDVIVRDSRQVLDHATKHMIVSGIKYLLSAHILQVWHNLIVPKVFYAFSHHL